MYRCWVRVVVLLLVFPVAAAAQKGHAKDVLTELPMPELFLQPVKYVAHTGTTVVYLRTEEEFCFNSQGAPLIPCMVVPYTTDVGSAPWVETELPPVVLPRKTLRQVIAMVPRFGPGFTLRNHDQIEHDGMFQARLIVTLESTALPNGAVRSSLGDRWTRLPLQPGKMFGDSIQYTRHGMIGRQWLRDNVGLTEQEVDAFFDSEITVRVSVMVRGALLESGSIYSGVLIEGY